MKGANYQHFTAPAYAGLCLCASENQALLFNTEKLDYHDYNFCLSYFSNLLMTMASLKTLDQ